jgi:hypothetical protein
LLKASPKFHCTFTRFGNQSGMLEEQDSSPAMKCLFTAAAIALTLPAYIALPANA